VDRYDEVKGKGEVVRVINEAPSLEDLRGNGGTAPCVLNNLGTS